MSTPFARLVVQAEALFEAEITYDGARQLNTTGGALRAAFLRRGATLGWPGIPSGRPIDYPGGERYWDKFEFPEVAWRWMAARASETTLKLILLVFATPRDAGPRFAAMFQARTLEMRRVRDGDRAREAAEAQQSPAEDRVDISARGEEVAVSPPVGAPA